MYVAFAEEVEVRRAARKLGATAVRYRAKQSNEGASNKRVELEEAMV